MTAPARSSIVVVGAGPAGLAVAYELGRRGLRRAATNPRLVCVGYTYPTTEGWLQALGRVAASAVDSIVAMPREASAGLPAPTES